MDYRSMKKVPLWNSYKSLSAARAGGKHAIPLVPKITNFFKSQKRKRRVTGVGTKRTKTIAQGRVLNEGTGGQCSYFYGRRGKSYLPKHVEDTIAPLVVQGNGAFQMKSAVGKQNIALAFSLNYPDLASSYTGDNISRILYKKATGDVTINNIYLSNAYVIIYDIMARKDNNSTTIGNPYNAWVQGDTDTSSSLAYTALGSTPWQTEAFNQYWKVVQTTDIVLCAGGTHVHKVRLNPEKVISSAYAAYTNQAFKDVTYCCLIEVHGSPANDTTTQTQVSIGVAGLNMIYDFEHTFKQLQSVKPVLEATNSLLTAFTVGEQVVNLGGSTIVGQAEG